VLVADRAEDAPVTTIVEELFPDTNEKDDEKSSVDSIHEPQSLAPAAKALQPIPAQIQEASSQGRVDLLH
jgi:hypothetical protein